MYKKRHIRLADIFIIFWNAVFKPGSFIRPDLDVVVLVVDDILVGVDRGCDIQAGHCGQWAAGRAGNSLI